MTRLAMSYVPSRAVADEVVQEAWLNVVRGLDGFAGRSSLRTWVFAILINCARKRAAREARTRPFADLMDPGEAGDGSDPSRFMPADHPRWARMWAVPVDAWGALPEDRLLGRECLSVIGEAIERLSPGVREVVILRDVEGWSSREVAGALGISEANQRVRLHRGRARVRAAVEGYLDQSEAT